MAESTFGVSAFIRLAGLKQGQAISSMKSRKFRQSKGFNPYLNLNRKIKNWALDLEDEIQALSDLSNSGAPSFRERNPNKFLRAISWISNSGFQSLPISELRYFDGPLNILRIKSEPVLFGYHEGQLYCIEIWHTESPNLSKWMISLGIGLMEEAFGHDRARYGNFAILDQRRRRLFSRINVKLPELDVRRIVEDHEFIWQELSPERSSRIIIDAHQDREFGFADLHPY